MSEEISEIAASFEISKRASQVAELISGTRLPLSNEKQLQTDLSLLLDMEGIEHKREFRLSAGHIVDFMLSEGVAIECKLRSRKIATWKQLVDYANHDQVNAIILVTNTAMGLPDTISGKPAYYCSLGAAWI